MIPLQTRRNAKKGMWNDCRDCYGERKDCERKMEEKKKACRKQPYLVGEYAPSFLQKR